jgi:antirestriction protein ArdC
MDVREQITASIIAAMQEGAPPWRKGWVGVGRSYNAVTGRPYTGINQVVLGLRSMGDPRWLTFKQAQEAGYQVRRGAKGVMLVKAGVIERDKDSDKRTIQKQDHEPRSQDTVRHMFLKPFWVFNATQIDGMPELDTGHLPGRQIEPAAQVLRIIEGMKSEAGGGLQVLVGGKPCYLPSKDTILMPQVARFVSREDHDATLVHEAAHATGHEKRLARPHPDAVFGSPEYAREELVAELASAMICGQIGLELSPTTIQSHAAYLDSWLGALQKDRNEIFRAATQAQKVCDYMSQFLELEQGAPMQPAQATPADELLAA